MDSVRSLSPLTICLCILLSAVLLGSSASPSSLWGKKITFNNRNCLWQLDAEVPALKELSVCLLLRLTSGASWTGFDYKAPEKTHKELGLSGRGADLEVWLFGEKYLVEKKLIPGEWYSVCLTWSGRAQRLRVYINGTNLHKDPVNIQLSQALSANGTLTLGVPHYIENGEVRKVDGADLIGDIGLFRMWARERSAEELRGQNCADGDVVSWDTKQWKYNCRPLPDNSLQCAWPRYKVKMWTFITHSRRPENCLFSLEEVTRNWLKSIFPRNMSVHDISVASPSHVCRGVNNSAALHVQHAQEPTASRHSCYKCFSCKFYVNMDPAANVEVVQAEIAALLNLNFSHNFLNLTPDTNSISILPAELFAEVTKPSPTVSTGVTTSETSPTHSLPAQPANMSTTKEPLDVNETAVEPDKFFRVNMTLSLTGSPTKPQDTIEKWVTKQLGVNKTMTVLNLVIKETVGGNIDQYNGQMIVDGQQKQYYCTFHVQEYNKNSVGEVKSFINAALTSIYENVSITIQPRDVAIKHLSLENCLEETTSTMYGQYIWPEAFPEVNQQIGCTKPESERAYRLCKLHIETDTTSWAQPDMRNCKALVNISGLINITVTTDNAAEVVDVIEDLVDVQLGNSAELSASDLDAVVEKLSEVVHISIIEPAVGAEIVNIVAEILLSKTDISPVASTVLNLTERMGNNMHFQEESVNVTAPLLALSMINADPDEFKGLTFGVSSISSPLIPKVFLNQSFVSEPLPDRDATISLPPVVLAGQRNKTRVQFSFFGTHELFQDPMQSINATQSSWRLNSFILSASINDSHVSNLKDRVVVTLRHQTPKQPEKKVQCVFWDFQRNGGQGGWNSRGCETQSISSNWTSCLCDHLTHFAVLLDVSRDPVSETDRLIMTVISYLGCGISSIFLGITLLTYLAFETLRRDYPSKILINLSTALLGLNMLFLLDAWLSSFSNYGLCIATAAMLHYFLLASFTWMGLEAVHMYFALVRVFNTYIPSYILKFCAVGWGVPLVVVSIVLAIDKDAYGSIVPEEAAVMLQSTDPFCWLQNDVFFYVTVVTFFLLILLCNISVFVEVLIQIRQMKANNLSVTSQGFLHDLRAVAGLTVLLGLTWALGFFSFGPARVVLLYLFCIFNSFYDYVRSCQIQRVPLLQAAPRLGVLCFLFHCLMKENVRKQWSILLYCGRFRLSDYSDWSRTVTVGGPGKKKNLVNSNSVASDSTSTIRKISGSSAGSASNYHQGA